MLKGKDWDKYLVCEGCNKRPTQCSCKKDEIGLKIIGIIVLVIIIIAIGLCFNI